MHPQFHAGDVCASSAGVADILKRRLLTLCSDALKLRNFHICIQDLATVDVLRDIDYPSCAYRVHCLRIYMRTHAYLKLENSTRVYLYSAWTSALSVSYNGQCEGLKTWNDNSRTPRFFYMPNHLTTNLHSWEFLCDI